MLCVTTFGAEAAEAPYPNRPVRVIVPFAPGGPSDILGRLTAQKLSEEMGQLHVVDNRGSAGGESGVDRTAGVGPGAGLLLAPLQVLAEGLGLAPFAVRLCAGLVLQSRFTGVRR